MLRIEAPALLPYEVLTALQSSGTFTDQALAVAAAGLDRFRLVLRLPQGALAETTVRFAEATGLTVYDASYVALARDLPFPLYSADEPLLEAAGEAVEARHIREYSGQT